MIETRQANFRLRVPPVIEACRGRVRVTEPFLPFGDVRPSQVRQLTLVTFHVRLSHD